MSPCLLNSQITSWPRRIGYSCSGGDFRFGAAGAAPAIPALTSALGFHSGKAMSSAQVPPLWSKPKRSFWPQSDKPRVWDRAPNSETQPFPVPRQAPHRFCYGVAFRLRAGFRSDSLLGQHFFLNLVTVLRLAVLRPRRTPAAHLLFLRVPSLQATCRPRKPRDASVSVPRASDPGVRRRAEACATISRERRRSGQYLNAEVAELDAALVA